MEDLCLAFIDEEQSIPVLFTFVPADGENESFLRPNYQNISVLGTVYQRPPIPTPEDYEPIPYPAPNWGVNIRLLDDEDIEPLRPYIIQPKNPVRVWA